MCTAIKYVSDDFYFGRTLDNDCAFGEEVVVVPRRFSFKTKHMGEIQTHHAIIGVATVQEGMPLFYDGCNEKGLAMAGLNFVGNAHYFKCALGKDNVASFEFIPWILGRCATVKEAKAALKKINIVDTPFNDKFPNGQLHWMIADKDSAIVVESEADGLHVYDNDVGVLTNNPPFTVQRFCLNNYMSVSPRPPKNGFSSKLKLDKYSRGMGALGLPGDLSSGSRFVRAAYTLLNSPACATHEESVSQFFHILGAVEMTRGSCVMDNGEHETTIYTSCCDATRGIYYYTAYNNHRITGVDMHKADLDGEALVRFPMIKTEDFLLQN